MFGDSVHMSFYCKAVSWEDSQGSGVLLTSGRCRLLSVVSQGKDVATSNAVKSVVLKDGSSSGSVLYQVAFPQIHYTDVALTYPYLINYQVIMGGDGILFESGIHFELSSSPYSLQGIDRLLLFYV